MIRGFAPKSPELKKLEGNKGRRPILEIPQFEAEDPGYPDWIPQSAKDEWHRLAPILIEKGLLTEPFKLAFVVYCMAWAKLEILQKKVSGMDIDEAIERGHMDALSKAMRQVIETGQKFGLNPVDLCRIKGIEPPKRNKLEIFLNKQMKVHDASQDS